jgi:hypothetical protein
MLFPAQHYGMASVFAYRRIGCRYIHASLRGYMPVTYNGSRDKHFASNYFPTIIDTASCAFVELLLALVDHHRHILFVFVERSIACGFQDSYHRPQSSEWLCAVSPSTLVNTLLHGAILKKKIRTIMNVRTMRNLNLRRPIVCFSATYHRYFEYVHAIAE